MRISTDFDNGAMATVRESAPGVFDLWPYRADEYGKYLELQATRPQDRERGETGDRDGANFTFHFRLDGCRGKKVVLRFHFSEIKERSGTSVVYANPDFPVWSPDGESWQRMPGKTLHDDPEATGGRIVVVEQELETEPVWVSFQYPYSNDRLTAYLERALRSPYCTAQTCGRFTEGRGRHGGPAAWRRGILRGRVCLPVAHRRRVPRALIPLREGVCGMAPA